MSEIRISDEAKSCADKIMANFISSGANASTAFIAAQAIEEILNQRDAELADKHSALSQEAGFLTGVIQATLHWEIPKELKLKLEDALQKYAPSQAGVKGGEK